MHNSLVGSGVMRDDSLRTRLVINLDRQFHLFNQEWDI